MIFSDAEIKFPTVPVTEWYKSACSRNTLIVYGREYDPGSEFAV